MSVHGFVYDINYNQEFTIFNMMANNRGIDSQKNVNGKYMLIRQAAESFKKWFNINLNKNDIDEAVGLLKVKKNYL
jgi:shikimate 5-dehydrogenase